MIRNLKMLKALSDMNRLRIVMALERCKELCACQIIELLQVTGATASRHLSQLQHAGLVESRKEGRWVHYRLAKPAEAELLFQWLKKTLHDEDSFQSDLQALEKIIGMTRQDLCRMQRGADASPDKTIPRRDAKIAKGLDHFSPRALRLCEERNGSIRKIDE